MGGPLPVGFDGVLDRPLHGQLELVDLGTGDDLAVGAQRTEEGLGGGLRCFGHGSIAAGATDSRTPKSGLCTGVGESSWVKFSRSTAGVLSLPAVVEVRAQRATKPPLRAGERFRGSGLTALAPQPTPEVGCFSGHRVSLRSAPGGLPTRPASRPAVEVRAPASHEATVGSRPLLGVRGLATLGPGGPPYSTNQPSPAVEVRAPASHETTLAGGEGFVARAWRPSHLNQRLKSLLLLGAPGLATVGPGGPPYSTNEPSPAVEVRAQRATKPPPLAGLVSWLGPDGPRTSTSVWGAAASRRTGSRYGRPWQASLLDQRAWSGD